MADKRVMVVDPVGVPASLPESEAADAVANKGYRYESREAGQERKLEKMYGDKPVQSFFQGLGNAATLGGLNVVLNKWDRQGAIEVPKRNKGSYVAGEVSSLLLGSPGGLVAKATGGASRLAGAGVARITTNKLAQRYVPQIVGGAVEGGIYGGSIGASDRVLNGDPLTIETFLADVGTGALLGGGAGLGAELVGDSLRLGRKVTGKVAQKLDDRVAAANAPKPTPFEPPALTAGEGMISDDVLDAVSKPFPKRDGSLYRAQKNALKAEKGALEAGAVAGREAAEADRRASAGMFRRFRSDMERLDELSSVNFRRGSEKTLPGHFTNEDFANVQRLGELRDRTRKAFGLERDLATKSSKRSYRWADESDEAIAAAFKKDPALRDALVEQGRLTAKVKSSFGDAAPFEPHRMTVVTDDAVRAAQSLDDVVARMNAQQVDPAKLADIDARLEALDKAMSMAGRDADKLAFAKDVVARAEGGGLTFTDDEMLMAIREGGYPGLKSLSELPPDALTIGKAKVYSEAARRLKRAKAGPVEGPLEGVIASPAEAAPAAGGGWMKGAVLGVVADWMLTGGMGMAFSGLLGAAAGRLMKGTVSHLGAKAASKATETAAKVARGVDDFLGKAASKTSKIRTPATMALIGMSFGPGDDSKPKNMREAYRARAAEVRAAAADPKTPERIREAFSGFAAADLDMGIKLSDAAFKRLMFLAETLPRNPGAGSPLALRDDWEPSDAAIAKWTRGAQVAENPLSVLDEMADGTLTVDHVEALKQVYPSMYERMRMDIIERIPELRADLDYKQRLTLSTFFQAPVESLMKPSAIFAMQGSFASESGTEPPQSGAGPRPTSTSIPEPTQAQRLSG